MDIKNLRQLWEALEASERIHLETIFGLAYANINDEPLLMAAQIALGRWIFTVWQEQRHEVAQMWLDELKR